MDPERGYECRRWLVVCHSKLSHSDLEIRAIEEQATRACAVSIVQSE